MNKKKKEVRTIEEAVERLKTQVFDRLKNGDNSLADIETIARVINSIAQTQEHMALARQSERFVNAEPIELAPGMTVPLGGLPKDAPPTEFAPGINP